MPASLCPRGGRTVLSQAADPEPHSLLRTPEREGAVLTRAQPGESLVGVDVWLAEEKRDPKAISGPILRTEEGVMVWDPTGQRCRGQLENLRGDRKEQPVPSCLRS